MTGIWPETQQAERDLFREFLFIIIATIRTLSASLNKKRV
jgi:hypothetical protein